MFSRVWKPDETLALVFEIVLHLPSIPFREQDIQKAGDHMAAGQ